MAEKLSVLSRLPSAFNRCNFLSFCLKTLQVKCFGYLLKLKAKILLPLRPLALANLCCFSLPNFLPVKADNNIV